MGTATPSHNDDYILGYLPEILKGIVYEVLDGQPIFYKGYQGILSGQKNLEEIRATIAQQALVVSCIMEYLFKMLSRNQYAVLLNEPGLRLNNRNYFVLDVAVYKKESLKKVTNKYLEIPPHLIFEIDTKADLSTFNNPMMKI